WRPQRGQAVQEGDPSHGPPFCLSSVRGGGAMNESGSSVERWAGGASPSEGLIRRILAAEGLQPYRWSNGPGDIYAAHTHPYHKVIYVVEGSITFGFPADGTATTLHAGD